jgi:hypothetical protein
MAAITRPADTDDPKPRGHMVQHLADSLTNHMQCAAATRTGVMLDIEPHVFAGELRRQAWPVYPRPRRFGSRQRKLGFGPCKIGFEVLKTKLQLIVCQPFGPPAKLAALQLLHDQPQSLDFRLSRGERGAVGGKGPHHPLQRLHIVRQCRNVYVHERILDPFF